MEQLAFSDAVEVFLLIQSLYLSSPLIKLFPMSIYLLLWYPPFFSVPIWLLAICAIVMLSKLILLLDYVESFVERYSQDESPIIIELVFCYFLLQFGNWIPVTFLDYLWMISTFPNCLFSSSEGRWCYNANNSRCPLFYLII